MTLLEHIVAHPETFSSAFSYLVWLTVKGGVILALALVIVGVFRRATAARLHLILCAALTAVFFLPALTTIFPQWPVSLLGNLPAPLIAQQFIGRETITAGDVVEQAHLPWSFWALSLWSLGSLAVISRTVLGLITTARIVSKARTVKESLALDLKESCRRQMGIHRSVKLAVCSNVASPFVWGIVRPVIVLPEEARQWSRRDLKYALVHELAHIKRLDSAWMLLATILAAVYWVNPLIWLVRKKIMIEAEKTCDDCVLTAGTNSAAYARHLLKVLDLLRKKREVAPLGVGMARRSHMEGRLMSILSDRKRSTGLKGSVVAVTFLLTILLVLPLAAVQVRAEQVDDTAKEEIIPDPDEYVPVDEMPEMIYSEAPKYPNLAKKAGVQGAVWIKALVDKKGDVVKAMIHKSSGFKTLDDAALEVADKNRYKPALQGDNPVMVWISYKVNFELDYGDETSENSDG